MCFDSLKCFTKHAPSKLEEVDYRGAVCIASSEDTLANIDCDTINILAITLSQVFLNFRTTMSPLYKWVKMRSCSDSVLLQGFSGPDGLHPQHTLDLISASAECGVKELLLALTSICNHVLKGNTPPSVHSLFFAATLIPLRYKNGGI